MTNVFHLQKNSVPYSFLSIYILQDTKQYEMILRDKYHTNNHNNKDSYRKL